MISAILLAQWRSMRTFRSGGLSLSTAFSWLSGFVFYGFWFAVAFGGEEFFKNPANGGYFAPVLSSGLLLVLLYWQITPIITASMGGSLDLKKLLAYPIPHRKLFAIELLLRVTTCLEMPILLFGAAVGLIRNPDLGGMGHALAVLVTMLVFIALNVFLTAAFRNLLERLLRVKRTKEVLMFLVVSISVLPQFLIAKHVRSTDIGKWLPDSPYLPWSAAGHILLGTDFAVPALTLLAVLAAAYLFARSQFERSLRFDGESGQVRVSSVPHARWDGVFTWPAKIFPDPIAAIIEKELRSSLRTPQFRFVLIMAAAFGLVLYLPARISNRQSSFMAENLISFASIYGILLLGNVSYFNCFGFERSAVQAWYSYPVPFRTTMIAKNISALSFILVELVLVTVTAAIFRFQIVPAKLFESFAVSLICALYLVAVGNLASVRLAHALNPERVSQAGSSKPKNAIILVAFPILVLPVGLAYWARSVFDSNLVFFGLLILAAGFGAVLYYIGLDSSVRIGMARRERILTDLSRGDGPVSVT